jgi:hypothetical protein
MQVSADPHSVPVVVVLVNADQARQAPALAVGHGDRADRRHGAREQDAGPVRAHRMASATSASASTSTSIRSLKQNGQEFRIAFVVRS